MALIRIPSENRTISGEAEVRAFLALHDIEYERVPERPGAPPDAPADVILAAYADKINALKQRGGYVTADVIDVSPDTPGLDAMLTRFSAEHWHDEDEVRYIVAGRGLFHIHPTTAPVFSIEVVPGDLIRVPRGTHHWFDLCADRRIRAIRLFPDTTGWTPHYTESGTDKSFQPLCFGPSHIRVQIPPSV